MNWLNAIVVKITLIFSLIIGGSTVTYIAPDLSTSTIQGVLTEAAQVPTAHDALSTVVPVAIGEGGKEDMGVPSASASTSTPQLPPVIINIQVVAPTEPTSTVITNVPETMKNLEVHADENQGNRFTIYVLVKQDGAELKGETVLFSSPEFKEPKENTTYMIGRSIPDSEGDVTHAQLHTGARFVYTPVSTSTRQTLTFSLKDDPKVTTDYFLDIK